MIFEPDDVLLVIDPQLDFMPGGALPVPGGDAILGPLAHLIETAPHVVVTQDWHPPVHASFASAHPGKRPFDTVELSYGAQILWPDHCIVGSAGAAFHPALDLRRAELVVRKGFRRGIDSYSAFRENDRATPTGLLGYLAERGLRRLVLAGLARDVCVHFTAEDASALGYDVRIAEDACRGLS